MTDKEYMLISDIDGTLLGDDDALVRFAQWYDERRNQLYLVYNSGRFVDSIRDLVQSTDLPEPDAMIGGVGTQIELARKGQLTSWPATSDEWDPVQVRMILLRYTGIRPQPPEAQTHFKVSFYAEDLDTTRLVDIQRNLMAAGLSVEMIYSSSRDLDVLPAGVNKGTASRYVASYWNIPFDHVAVAGDTGNDEAMFLQGFRGIVVGNAQDELKALTSPDIHRSSLAFADGVVEGIAHWFGETASMRAAS